jgi:RND family efflux transporter MFP subunit
MRHLQEAAVALAEHRGPAAQTGGQTLPVSAAQTGRETLPFPAAQTGRETQAVLAPGPTRVPGSSSGVMLEIVATLLECETLQAASIALVAELAARLACERASIGFLESHDVEVVALSHSARFDPRSKLARGLAAAMAEAIDEESTTLYPEPDGQASTITRAHRELYESQGASQIVSVPLSARGEKIGALLFEFDGAGRAGGEALQLMEQTAALVGPLLESLRRDQRGIGSKLVDALRTELDRRLGPERPGARLIASIAVATALGIVAFPATYRVSGPARLEGTVQRVVVAPVEGYIAESRRRAGDLIQAGDLLGALDDRDLRLEHRKWTSQRAQIAKDHRAALASHDRSEVRSAWARLEQADAEIALLEEQLTRTRLVAPFDGVVAKGDLSRSLGSPVERGEVLFEVAPLESYRIVLEVDEREISAVSPEQTGSLTLSSMPGKSLPLRVERVVPVSVSEDSRNFFRVEARLEQPPKNLRPGMEGVGKIDAGRHSLAWIWTHRAFDWVRLQIWKWLP